MRDLPGLTPHNRDDILRPNRGDNAGAWGIEMKFGKQRRRDKLRSQPFPDAWESTLRRFVPLYARLPAADRAELHGHIQVLLDEKRFEGCGGLAITDDIRLTIAAQAAVLLLHRETDFFPNLVSILVYPTTYVAPVIDSHYGVVTEFEEERAGETWGHGSLVLSWDDVTGSVAPAPTGEPEEGGVHGGGNGGPRRGSSMHAPPAAAPDDDELVPAYNVVLHEFAHQLDQENGEMDGVPVLPSREARQQWARVMQDAFEQLDTEYDEGKEPVIDEYALEDPAEFFAVATECFFETPFAILEEYPQVYDVLARYYEQDPASWRL